MWRIDMDVFKYSCQVSIILPIDVHLNNSYSEYFFSEVWHKQAAYQFVLDN